MNGCKKLLLIALSVITVMSGILSSITVKAADENYTNTPHEEIVDFKLIVEDGIPRTYWYNIKQNPNSEGKYCKHFDVVPVVYEYKSGSTAYRGVSVFVINALDIVDFVSSGDYCQNVGQPNYSYTDSSHDTSLSRFITLENVELADGSTQTVTGSIYELSEQRVPLSNAEGTHRDIAVSGSYIRLGEVYSDIAYAKDDALKYAMAMVCSGISPTELGGGTIEGDGDKFEFDENIGYLQGFRVDEVQESIGSGINSYGGEHFYKAIWDDTTTTGFNTKQENVYIAGYVSLNAWTTTNPFGIGEKEYYTGPRRFVKKVSQLNEMTFAWINELLSVTQPDMDILIEQRGALGKIQPWYSLWYRVEVFDEETNSWKYGGWIRLSNTEDNSEDGELIQTVTPDDEVDPDGGVGDGVPNEGNNNVDLTPDNDEDDSIPIENINIDTIGDLFANWLDGISDLIGNLGDLPNVIGRVFTAFPASLTSAIVFGIILAIVLRIIGR